MKVTSTFIRVAALACFASVITTLGIHAFFPDPPAGFEDRILLYKNSLYLLNRWWVIVHCMLVMVAMWGIAVLRIRQTPGAIGLGFLCFAVFGFTEITRQMYVLFYMNGLRELYHLSSDDMVKNNLKIALDTAGMLGSYFFGVFIFCFALGNGFYGLSFIRERGFSKILGLLLIVWCMGSLTALGNHFWRIERFDQALEWYNASFQPLMRLLLGIWLWKSSTGKSFK